LADALYNVNVASFFVLLTMIPCEITPAHPVERTYAKNGLDSQPSGTGNVTVKSTVFPASTVTALLADIIEPLILDSLLWFREAADGRKTE